MPPRRKATPGLLARLTAGMDPKLIASVVLILITSGGNWIKSSMDAEGTREQVEQAENRSQWQRGHLRATVDSLGRRLASQDRRIARLERRLRVGPRASIADSGEWVGPPEPERRGTLLRSLKRLFGG